MKAWKDKKDQEANQIAESNRSKELIGVTFQPVINKNSKKMLSNKPRVPIYEREIKPRPVATEFTFTPKINKRKVA